QTSSFSSFSLPAWSLRYSCDRLPANRGLIFFADEESRAGTSLELHFLPPSVELLQFLEEPLLRELADHLASRCLAARPRVDAHEIRLLLTEGQQYRSAARPSWLGSTSQVLSIRRFMRAHCRGR